jgi:DNA polymerase
MLSDDVLIIDFETRSRADLTKIGAHKYALDESTQIICMGWRLRGETGVWRPLPLYDEFNGIPGFVADYIINGDGLVVAWNAEFDRQIWINCMPDNWQFADYRWYCAAAQARVNAMPGGLGNCTKALTGRNQKDIRGDKLIRMLSIPQADGSFNNDQNLLMEMADYCARDVDETHRCLSETRFMTPTEHRDWLNTVEVNDNGVRIDTELAAAAAQYAEEEASDIGAILTKLTNGKVTKHTQIQRAKEWVQKHIPPGGASLMTVYKKGEKKESFDKAVRQRLLVADDEHVLTLPAHVREVIELVDAANKSSVAKYKTMLDRADPEDQRVRGAFVYAGAGQTLRFAARGLQLHNFTRDCFPAEVVGEMRDKIIAGAEITKPLHSLARMLRSALIPDNGNVFVVGDWSSIEARALPWLAGDFRADDRLKLFEDDVDIYEITATKLGFDDRQIGKVAELSLGYAGGVGAFQTMAGNYGVAVNDAMAQQVVRNWRLTNPWAVHFWNALEKAAKKAVANPGKVYEAGRVSYCFYPSLISGTLVCTLPDGSTIQYPKAALQEVMQFDQPQVVVSALKANWTPAAGEREWPRVVLWRGLLAENVTQALCAALLRDAVDRALRAGFPVVAHVHDEIITEVSAGIQEDARSKLRQLMETRPKWAPELPLKAEPTVMHRYGK